MLTATFTADEAIVQTLDAIEKRQNRSRALVLADAIAAYAAQQDVSETPVPDEEDPLLALFALGDGKYPR